MPLFDLSAGLADQASLSDTQYFSSLAQAAQTDWSVHATEGQLSVDVLETAEELVVVATMAGTRPEDIEMHLHTDSLTIRGKRLLPVSGVAGWHTGECFWGKFSRTVVLPVDVKAEMARSEYRYGVLTVYLPKAKVSKGSIPILVVDE